MAGNKRPGKRRQRIIWQRFLPFLGICFLLIGGIIYGGVRMLLPVADEAAKKMYPRGYQELV